MDPEILNQVAERIVDDIHNDPHQFQPLRRREFWSRSEGWPDRLKNYQWPTGTEFRPASANAEAISERVLSFVKSYQENPTKLTDADFANIAKAVFNWGGVGKNSDKNHQLGAQARAVIESALAGERLNSAPMSSSWTKLAAFASHGQEIPHPQIIFDSRVANSLATRLERLASDLNPTILAQFRDELGYISGRGGSRKSEKIKQIRSQQGWRIHRYDEAATKRWWKAHFLAGELVQKMRVSLNQNFAHFGHMPSWKDDGAGEWTTRGVEMVLFMDGY